MSEVQGARGGTPMHRASILVRHILVLNESMEFMMRREMNVNETDFQAMQHLIKERSMTPAELAQMLHLTPAATTTVIDRLVGKGHAKRTPHPTDRRRWLITPSAESVRSAMEKLMPMILDVDSKARNYNAAEQSVIVDFLGGVVAAMGDRVAALECEWASKTQLSDQTNS